MSAFFPLGRLLILPSRMAVGRERRSLLEASPEGVIIGPRVMTFGHFEQLLTEPINPTPRPLSELGRQMIIDHLVASESRKPGWPVKNPGPGIRQALAILMDELVGRNIEPEVLGDLGKSSAGRPKLMVLSSIYSAYLAFLEQNHLMDRAGRRRALLEDLCAGQIPRPLSGISEIVVRDFSRLTQFQVKLLQVLSVHFRVTIQLVCPDWLLQFSKRSELIGPENPFIEFLASVNELEKRSGPESRLELIFAPPEPQKPALVWLTNLFRPKLPQDSPPEPAGAVEIMAAPGRYQEIEEIGRRIWELINLGHPPEGIAVAVRDLGIYGQMIEDVFRRFGLPLFFRRGEPLSIQTPVRAVAAILNLANSRWNLDLILDLLASPYLNLGLEINWSHAARLLAKAGVTDDRAGGGWEPNLARLAGFPGPDQNDAQVLLQGIRRLKKVLLPLTKTNTWAGWVEEIAAVMINFRFEELIMAGHGPYLYRDLAAWNALNSTLQGLILAAEEAGQASTRLDADSFERGLRQAVKDQNIGGRSQNAGGVMVLSLFDLHGLSFDYLFLAGLNEGEFPRPRPADGHFLSDEDRQAVNMTAGRLVIESTAAKYHQEELLFYQAVSAARTKLTLSYCYADEQGRPRLPSALLDEVIRLWPENLLEVETIPAKVIPPLDQALTREELLSGLALNLYSRSPGPMQELAQEILDRLIQRPLERSRWDFLVQRAKFEPDRLADSREKNEGAAIKESLAVWLKSLETYEGAPILSVTFLQEYAACPWAFQAATILGLAPLEEADDEIDPRDEGSILHRILKTFLERCRDDRRLPLSGSPEEALILKSVMVSVFSYVEKTRPVGRRPLWQAKKRAMSRMLERWLAAEQAQPDTFVPAHFEWSFGPSAGESRLEAPPFEVPLLSGGRLFFKGRIDRLDFEPNGIRVMDYKASSDVERYNRLLKEEELGVTSFQAPLYQSAAAGNFGLPAQTGWILLKHDNPLGGKLSPSTNTDFFALDLDRRRRMDESGQPNFFNRLESTWLRLLSGDFKPVPGTENCPYCPYRTACRAATIE